MGRACNLWPICGDAIGIVPKVYNKMFGTKLIFCGSVLYVGNGRTLLFRQPESFRSPEKRPVCVVKVLRFTIIRKGGGVIQGGWGIGIYVQHKCKSDTVGSFTHSASHKQNTQACSSRIQFCGFSSEWVYVQLNQIFSQTLRRQFATSYLSNFLRLIRPEIPCQKSYKQVKWKVLPKKSVHFNVYSYFPFWGSSSCRTDWDDNGGQW